MRTLSQRKTLLTLIILLQFFFVKSSLASDSSLQGDQTQENKGSQTSTETKKADIQLPPEKSPSSEALGAKENLPDIPKREPLSLEVRDQKVFNISPHISPFSTWISPKIGLDLGIHMNPNWTLEAEFTRGSLSGKVFHVEFGQIVDQRYGLKTRWYLARSNSFHLLMGVFKSQLKMEIGPSIITNIPGGPNTSVLNAEAYGPLFGFGNRWQWAQGYTLGIDWFTVYIPTTNKRSDLGIAESITPETDKNNIKDILNFFLAIPEFDVLKINFGYSF